MRPYSNTRVVLWLRFYVKWACILTVCVGMLAISGWVFDVDVFKSIIPNAATMKFNTALCFICGGLSLWLMRDEASMSGTERLGRILGAITFLIGLLTLIEYTFHLDFGIDQIIIPDLKTPVDSFPGRMSLITAVGFTLLGGNLLFIGRRASQYFSIGIVTLSLLAIIGYLFDYRSLYQLVGYGSVAIHTSLNFLFLSLAILAARPSLGMMEILTSPREGGRTIRLLLPFTTVVIVFLGWLIHRGQTLGLLASNNALAILIVMVILIYSPLLFRYASRINKTENELIYKSLHDSLTGLFNRHVFEDEVSRLERGRSFPVSILIVDLDSLKQINDRFGHVAGDKALKRTAKVLMEAFRAEDVVARIGGDEFAVLLPKTAQHVARALRKRVQDLIKEANHTAPPDEQFHVSIGIGSTLKSTDLWDVFKRADANLYRDKKKNHKAGEENSTVNK